MKIALFTTSFPSRAGTALNAGICVRDFAAILTELGHEVEVLTPFKRGARHDFEHRRTTFFRWLGSADSVSHLRLARPLEALQLSSAVIGGAIASLALVRRFKPDHVLCFWVFPCGLWAHLAQRATGTPYSVWALGSDIWALRELPGMPRVLRRIARSASARYADGLLLARDFASLARAEVEFLATSRVLEAPEGAQRGAGGYHLFLGRYHPNKGIDLLIEAVGRARARLPPSFRLRTYGFGPLEGALRARVRELGLSGSVEIHPPTAGAEVSSIIFQARGLIIPSRIESVPLVLSDGLQMSCPLLVTDVGDMGELVRRHGAGLVCKPDVDDLAEALVRFAHDPPAGGNEALRKYLDIRESARRFLAHVEHDGGAPLRRGQPGR